MFCKNCGFAIIEGANFCSNCGQAIIKPTEPDISSESNMAPAPQENITPPVSEAVLQSDVTEAVVTEDTALPNYSAPSYNEMPQNQSVSSVPQQSKPKDNSGFAIAALVLGIIGVFPVYALNFIPAVLALIFGIISRKSSKSAMAVAGIVLGSVGIALAVAVMFVFFYFILTVALESSGGMYF